MNLIRGALFAISLAAMAAPVQAQGEGAPPPLLNEPTAGWAVYGPGQTHKARKDRAVQGGAAMRINVAAKAAHAWDIGASVPIAKPIAKGDRLILAIWVRLIDGDEGARLGATIQQSEAPYSAIVTGHLDLTREWKLAHIKGVAADDYAAGRTNIALTLGDAARTIDVGPAFVMKAD